MNKNANSSFLLRYLRKQLSAKPRLTNSKDRVLKACAHILTFALCFALIVQCVAILQPVNAQSSAINKVAQTKKKKTRKNRKKKPAQDTEAAAALKAQELAQKEAEDLAKKQAADLARQEAAEKLAQKRAEENEKKEAAKKEAEERTTSRPTLVMPPYTVWPTQSPASAPSAQTNVATTVPQTTKEFAAADKTVRDLGPVSMSALSHQKGMLPSSVEPVELRAIHPPQDPPQEARSAVGKPAIVKEAKKRKESLDSPIAGVPSPLMTRTFRSDFLSIGFIPPDTMGAVGPSHVVTMTNERVIVQDRNGVTLSNVTLASFWATLPNGLANPSTFDPKILYDRFNDRFIMVTQANAQNATSATLIATSQTGDPLGTWNRYAIDVDAAATSAGGSWADYPSIGFNKNWIVISINRFGFGNKSGYQGPSIYVINKTTAYAGTLGAVSVFEDSFSTGCLNLTPAAQPQALGCGFTMVPAITQDNTTSDEYLVEDWDSTFGQLRMTKVSGTVATPTLTVGYQFPQSPYAWRFNASLVAGSAGYMPQRQQNLMAASGTRIAANDSRIQDAVLRNGTLWTTHTVMLARLLTPAGILVGSGNPDIRSAVQWWQIDPLVTNPSAGTPPLQRNFISDPRADNCHNGTGGTRAGCTVQTGDFYAFPNLNVNANNDVVIGYSRFSASTLPKAAYSFRGGGDPPNTMRDSMVYREGQGQYNLVGGTPQTTRWGDYSSVMVDPVNDTDFWTIQEYSLDQRNVFFGPTTFHGLWSTWWALITPATTANYAFNGGLIISEFRMRGPGGARDEFVELINPTDSPITISTTDGSDGWSLAYSDTAGAITQLAVIPNGFVIPAHGHFLITNEARATGINPYSLSGSPTGNPVRTADSDAMYTADNLDNGGFALFRTSNVANFIEAARVDAVGFTSLPAGSIYREGNGLATCSGTPGAEQISFVRKGTAGNPQDTNANENDFIFTSSTGASSQNCQIPVTSGAPTPLNRDAPPSP